MRPSARTCVIATGAAAVATLTTGVLVAAAAAPAGSHVQKPQPGQVVRAAHFFRHGPTVGCAGGYCLPSSSTYSYSFTMPATADPGAFTLTVSARVDVAGRGHFGMLAGVNGAGRPSLRPAHRPLAATRNPTSTTVQFAGHGLRAGKTYTVDVDAYRLIKKNAGPLPDGHIVLSRMAVELLAPVH